MITIFTPTYNRAHTLPRLYKSLVAQNRPDFFEWLIVDDGSSDGTAELVKKFQAEQKISIRYYFQENQGKHFAINRGLELAAGDYFVNIDSDDFLVENAMKEIEKLIPGVEKNNFGGFSFIHFAENINFNPEEFGNKTWQKPEAYFWKHEGEMMFCIRTEIYQQFPFPEFEREKFCPESLVLRRIEKMNRILYTDKVLARGEYLNDGLSAKFYKLLHENPHGALLNYKEKIRDDPNAESKLYLAKNYYDIAWKSDKTTIKEKFFNINPFLTIRVLLERLKN